MAVAEEHQRRAVFSALQPIMTQILPAGTTEQHMLSLLKALHTLLCKDETVQKHLGLCFDYVWFPFQYILSSISATRTLSGLPSQQSSQKATLPCLASPLVAERALQCVRRILDLAKPPLLPSTLAILAQLSELTHMNRQSGNEQMMHDTLASICLLLPVVKNASWKEHPQETRIWAVTVGMLFHGLLEIIDAERLGKGHGAPKLATAATQGAKAAVSCLESQADRAAYYLPGLASNACAVLMESSTRLPASCHAATCTLLQDVLLLTTKTTSMPKGACPKQHTAPPQAPLNAAAALTALASSSQAPAQVTASSDRAEAAKCLTGPTSGFKAPSDPFTTPRDAAWLRQTLESLGTMLPQALRAVRVRKSASVRSAAASLCIALLEQSAIAQHEALLQPLLHTVLLLSDDSTTAVCSPCIKFLCASAACKPGGASNRLWQELTAVAEEAAQELSGGVAWREESVLNSARLLAAALKGLPAFVPETSVVSGPAQLLEVVIKLLEFDLPAAALWLQGHNGITAQGATARRLCAESHASVGASTVEGYSTSKPSERDTNASLDAQQNAADSHSNRVAAKTKGSSVEDPPEASEGSNPAERLGEGSQEDFGSQKATSAAARALQALPAALQQATSSASNSIGMPFGLKRMEQEQTFQAVASVAAATGSMCAAAPSEQQRAQQQSWEGSSAFDAVEYVRVEMEAAAPRLSRKRNVDTDHSKLVAALLKQAQLLTALSAFLSGCASGLRGGRTAAVSTVNTNGQTSSSAAASSEGPAAETSSQDNSSDHAQDSSSPSTEQAFFQPLIVSLRSISRCASKVMELGAGTLGEVVSSGELPAHLVATSPSVRDLSAACAVHAYAVSVYVEHMAVDAAAVLRNDDAMLRAVLLPLLQGSAAAGPFVAARSAAAVTALCKCRGYEGWSDLVSDNLDYVVDGLVLHIRDPTRFPHAPHLLAALLTSSSVSQALLPALAEPASAAIQGLSILSRGLHPQRVGAFLAALTPIAAALSEQAHEIRRAAHHTLSELRKRKLSTDSASASEQQYDDVCSQSASGSGRCEVEEVPTGNSLEGEVTEEGDGRFKEASEFFAQYHKPHQIVLPKEELKELDRRRGMVYAAAELCSAITNASAPLLVAEDLRVALAAHKTVAVLSCAHCMQLCGNDKDVEASQLCSPNANKLCMEALTALGFLTDADDVDTRDIIEYFEVPGTAQRPGDIERVLPQVHQAWGFFVPGLRAQAQPARLAAALTLIARVSECAGSFIAKRMQTDVLPQLKLMISGSPGITTKAWLRSGRAVRVVDEAPGTVARCQTLALSTLEHMCQFKNGRESLSSIAGKVAVVTAETLCRETTGAHVRELCAKLLKGLATVDGAAVKAALKENLAGPCSHSVHALLQNLLDAVTVVSANHRKVVEDSAPGGIESQLLDLTVT